MKRTIVASTIVSALLLAFGCAEDNHGRLDQLDESLPAPQPVEVTKVKPISGGAVLWVKIPDDKNIKGVVASYTRGGVNVEAKVSRYVDSLKVEGYADTDEHEIEVCSFNVNEVKSKPVTVCVPVHVACTGKCFFGKKPVTGPVWLPLLAWTPPTRQAT